MKFNTKFTILLVLVTLCLLVLPSHCYTPVKEEGDERAEEELFHCLGSCSRQAGRSTNERELSECEQKCVKQYKERKGEERGGRGGGDESSSWYPHMEDPREVYEQCKSDCYRKGSRQQQFQCRRTCKLRLEEQTRQQEERERGGGGGGGVVPVREEDVGPEEELFDCFVKCDTKRRNDEEDNEDERELSECDRKCVDHYKERKSGDEGEREPRRGGSGVRVKEEDEGAEEELFDCFVKCDRKQRNDDEDERELSECDLKCVEHYKERKRQEGDEREGRHGRGGGGGGSTENHHHRDPERQYKQCQSTCPKRQGEQRQYCQQKCRWQYEKQKREQGREGGRGGDVTNPRKEREEQGQSNNPYFFESQRFDSKYRTEHGHVKVLERFNKMSKLLQGIENYRLAVLEANPNTFVLPHHSDAESVLVVVGGKGTISYVWQNQRQSHNVKQGDVMRVPAGSIMYLINRDDDERLYVLKLLQPINTPGRFQEYFGVGGENPESFYRTFSNEILEAAFNTQRERLEKLFGQQRKGVIIKASKEQIRALSQQSETSRGRKGESLGPFDLLKERPLFSNRFGQYFEASPDNYKQLQDLDVAVSFMNITNGGMVVPHYNSRSTKLVFVVGGSGQFEMACPHLSARTKTRSQMMGKKQGQTTGVHYQKVSARLSVGDAFVIPAGHPIAIVASQNSNLQLASFGIKGSQNQKYFLAGRENIWEQVESEAKGLSFGMPAAEVEEIFRSQEQSYFVPGPGQKSEGRTWRTTVSILDFVDF